jgi:hypothetical protein
MKELVDLSIIQEKNHKRNVYMLQMVRALGLFELIFYSDALKKDLKKISCAKETIDDSTFLLSFELFSSKRLSDLSDGLKMDLSIVEDLYIKWSGGVQKRKKGQKFPYREYIKPDFNGFKVLAENRDFGCITRDGLHDVTCNCNFAQTCMIVPDLDIPNTDFKKKYTEIMAKTKIISKAKLFLAGGYSVNDDFLEDINYNSKKVSELVFSAYSDYERIRNNPKYDMPILKTSYVPTDQILGLIYMFGEEQFRKYMKTSFVPELEIPKISFKKNLFKQGEGKRRVVTLNSFPTNPIELFRNNQSMRKAGQKKDFIIEDEIFDPNEWDFIFDTIHHKPELSLFEIITNRYYYMRELLD